MSNRVKLTLAFALLAGLPALAVSTKFSDFLPLTSSAVGLPVDGPEEATPISLSNSKWSERTVADRRTQNNLVLNSNSGNWDMITSNETGPDAGRYLFMPFETGTAGVQRIDLQNPHYESRTVTIVAPGEQGFVSGDASRWAPWGGYLTAEESWGTGSTKGRLFEVRNPITAGPDGGDFIWRSILPRVAHEGLAFDKDGSLVMCIAGMGLYRVDKQRNAQKMTAETNRSRMSVIDDSRMRLADDLDIGPDGKVYFSEATIRYGFEEWVIDALEGRGNGRIIRYDPAAGTTRTILRNLLFPNGMCMAHDNKSVLFAETWGCRVSRYWLEGPKQGTTAIVIADLPGYPDNINRGSRGTYWVALAGMRTPSYDLAMSMPAFRRRMARRVAGDEWLFPNVNVGCVIRFDPGGHILESLWDRDGDNHPAITSMREHRGYLYLGGVTNNRIGRIKLADADPDWTGPDSYWGAALRPLRRPWTGGWGAAKPRSRCRWMALSVQRSPGFGVSDPGDSGADAWPQPPAALSFRQAFAVRPWAGGQRAARFLRHRDQPCRACPMAARRRPGRWQDRLPRWRTGRQIIRP